MCGKIMSWIMPSVTFFGIVSHANYPVASIRKLSILLYLLDRYQLLGFAKSISVGLSADFLGLKCGLIGGIPIYPSEKYEFVSWDDYSQLNRKIPSGKLT